MKKNVFCILFPLIICLFSCKFTNEEQVTLKFIQHSYIMHSNENSGYYFKNDQLAITEINYEKGFNLDKIEINNLYKKINYTVPKLVGDGYWSFTFFTTSFDESTGFSNNYLDEQVLYENLTIHFAIYG